MRRRKTDGEMDGSEQNVCRRESEILRRCSQTGFLPQCSSWQWFFLWQREKSGTDKGNNQIYLKLKTLQMIIMIFEQSDSKMTHLWSEHLNSVVQKTQHHCWLWYRNCESVFTERVIAEIVFVLINTDDFVCDTEQTICANCSLTARASLNSVRTLMFERAQQQKRWFHSEPLQPPEAHIWIY